MAVESDEAKKDATTAAESCMTDMDVDMEVLPEEFGYKIEERHFCIGAAPAPFAAAQRAAARKRNKDKRQQSRMPLILVDPPALAEARNAVISSPDILSVIFEQLQPAATTAATMAEYAAHQDFLTWISAASQTCKLWRTSIRELMLKATGKLHIDMKHQITNAPPPPAFVILAELQQISRQLQSRAGKHTPKPRYDPEQSMKPHSFAAEPLWRQVHWLQQRAERAGRFVPGDEALAVITKAKGDQQAAIEAVGIGSFVAGDEGVNPLTQGEAMDVDGPSKPPAPRAVRPAPRVVRRAQKRRPETTTMLSVEL